MVHCGMRTDVGVSHGVGHESICYPKLLLWGRKFGGLGLTGWVKKFSVTLPSQAPQIDMNFA